MICCSSPNVRRLKEYEVRLMSRAGKAGSLKAGYVQSSKVSCRPVLNLAGAKTSSQSKINAHTTKETNTHIKHNKQSVKLL